MTDAPRRPKRSQRPAVIAYAGSLLAFAAIVAVLAVRVAAGADPAIAPEAAAPAASPSACWCGGSCGA